MNCQRNINKTKHNRTVNIIIWNMIDHVAYVDGASSRVLTTVYAGNDGILVQHRAHRWYENLKNSLCTQQN